MLLFSPVIHHTVRKTIIFIAVQKREGLKTRSMEEEEDYYSDRSSEDSQYYEHDDQFEEEKFYVTRESQENLSEPTRKYSYAGMRDLSELDKIQEEDIVASDGSIRGIKNRVRAGLANFENPDALQKKRQEEGRIILYVTSFRGVRSTFEECRYVETILHNLRMKAEIRDIYVNKQFYRELEDRLEMYDEGKLPVPQLFISGQHIGGREEVEELNESGKLRRLLETFERKETSKSCGYCGGYEFIPCRKCGGTKDGVRNNFTDEFKALRCTHCNENGLEACPGCKATTADGKALWDEEELKKWKEREEFERRDQEEMRKREKRERIKREALEAEFQKQLKKEREQAERQRMKEERRKKRAKEMAATTKVVDDIEMELEKERQWKEERMALTHDQNK